MTIILRLQGLDVKAGTEDIRRFFKCLHIPDGGVYIVGGSHREAFIAFATERDAQLAMQYSGKILKGSKVTLHISRMEELEHRLKFLLKKKKPSPTQSIVNRAPPSPDANLQPLNAGPHTSNNLSPMSASAHDSRTANLSQPLDLNTSNLQPSNEIDYSTAFLLGIFTVLKGLQSSDQGENNEPVPRVVSHETCNTVPSNELRTPKQSLCSKPGYVRLFGLPASATKEVICKFFNGLKVEEAIVNVKLGLGHGCLVKFGSEQEACSALLFNQQSLGPICVEVRGATEKMWTSALQECENTLVAGESRKSNKSPLRETANHKPESSELQIKRPSVNQLPPKSQKRLRSDGDTAALSPNTENTVMVSNLPKTITKTEIKELFECPHITHRNVLHLLDKRGNRTDTAFVIFNNTEDYDYAMNLTGCHVGSNAIEVSSISKMMMRDMMAKTRPWSLESDMKKPNRKRKCLAVEIPEEQSNVNMDPAAQTCLFVRNLPADVQKSQIKSLFSNYRLNDDDVILLLDSNGKGIGEAMLQLKSPKHAALAQRLHGQNFLGTKLLLTCINVKQMEDILARNV